MVKKIYAFSYDYNKAIVRFKVDLQRFSPEMANETLAFFSWDYDKDANPVDEVMKKYAFQVINKNSGSGLFSVERIMKNFNHEGFLRIDGSIGITLVDFEEYEFDIDDLEMEVSDD